MNENQLREYWYAAYVDALRLLKNHDKVTVDLIAKSVQKYGNTVFNRLFCLVVWQEVKKIRAGHPSLPQERYSEAVTDAWKVFRKYSEPKDTEEFWNDLNLDIHDISKKYGQCDFIIDLLVRVTFEEIERIWKSNKKGEITRWMF